MTEEELYFLIHGWGLTGWEIRDNEERQKELWKKYRETIIEAAQEKTINWWEMTEEGKYHLVIEPAPIPWAFFAFDEAAEPRLKIMGSDPLPEGAEGWRQFFGKPILYDDAADTHALRFESDKQYCTRLGLDPVTLVPA